MSRRKPRDVQRGRQQRKRQLQAVEDGRNTAVGGDANAAVADGAALQKKRRKHDGVSARHALREVDGVCVNATNRPLKLTLDAMQRGCDSEGWEDALWFSLPVQAVSRDRELNSTDHAATRVDGVPASDAFVDAVTRALSQDASDHEEGDALRQRPCRLGLELKATGGCLTLINCRTQTKTETKLMSADAFPGTYPMWIAHVLDLVERELLTLELEEVGDDEDKTLVWRVGVAWRKYVQLCYGHHDGPKRSRKKVQPPVVILPRIELHASMHRVMLWAVKHSRSPHAHRLFDEQCSFPYWDELELLYSRFVGDNAPKVAEIAHRATGAVSDLYARIDTRSQLKRSVDTFDAAIERASEQYRKTTNGGGGDESAPGHSLLVPTLRPYQKAAVSWMLEREQRLDNRIGNKTSVNSATINLNVTFPGAANAPEMRQHVTYDPFCAAFVDWRDDSVPNDVYARQYDMSTVCGGILADEMGLGKTVEVISLVLSHPNPVSLPVLQHAGSSSFDTQEADRADTEEAEADEAMEMDCICGTDEAHELGVVKCELCGTWHHQICSGFAPTSSSSRGVWTFDLPASGTIDEQESFAFMCFHCQIRERPWFSSKTTLIVSPESIHDQWEAELKRHVRSRDALSLLRYPGVKALRSRLRSGLSAEWQVLSTAGLRLATYDIVLTTYEALRTDLRHLPTPAGRDRRASTRQTRKKYAFMASPLVFLEFWRVCMDEAQVGVESTMAQTALTISQLRARSTWIVTGTPFSKSSSVSDLFGYLKFLRIEPFASGSEAMFRDVVASAVSAGAIDRVLDLLFWDGKKKRGSDRQRDGGGLLWRTSKRDVLNQLHLPTQRSLVVLCRFSQVERHFYEQQERAIVSLIRQRERIRSQQRDPSDNNDEDAVIDGRDRIWHDLLELRKICCHPQIGNAFGAANGAGVTTLNGRRLMPTAVLTMDEFLRELIARNKRECEEAQRKLVAARNGLAAMRLLSSSDGVEVEEGKVAGVVAAIQEYLAAIQLIQTNWPLFRADLLPRLHILENLARLVRLHFDLDPPSSEVDRTEDDSVDITSSSGSTTTTDDGDNDTDQLNSGEEDRGSESSHRNPKQHHLLPLLPVLSQQLATVNYDTTSASITSRETSDALGLECAQLDKSANSIRQFYLLQVENAHDLAKRNFKMLEAKITAQVENKSRASSNSTALLCSSSMWWNDALATIERADAGEQADSLVARIHARLAAFGTKWATRFCAQLVSARTLRLQLVTELEALAKRRRALFNALKALSVGTPSHEEVQRSGNCRKCRDAGNGPVCAHCKLYKELDAYRQHVLGIDSSANNSSLSAMLDVGGSGHARLADLFDEGEEEEEEDHQASTASRGTAASSLLVEVFKEIAASARAVSKHASPSSSSLIDVSAHLQHEVELFALLLREWNAAKKLFQMQHQRLGALDELEMASSQIRLRIDGEAVTTAAEKLYIIDAFAVPTRLAELEADRAIAERELHDALAQLRFLLQLADEQQKGEKAIAKGRNAHTNGDGTDGSIGTSASAEGRASASSSSCECAVCLQEMDGDAATATRAVLLCAHAFCRSCVETLARRRRGLSVKCPTCRRVTPADRVAIVAQGHSDSRPDQQSRQQTQTMSGTGRPGAGSGFGSKMDALLRCVRALVDRDPDVKCLLFSQWHDMLSIVSEYLRAHVDGVSCFVYSTKRAFPTLLRDFKACPRACVLALPFAVGANGLNIVEATEVLLVEPLLNASTEAQAINRVHRIGQTRPTNVHRFIVETTVEERIHWLGKTRHQSARARLGTSSSGEVSRDSDSPAMAMNGPSDADDDRKDAEGEEESGDDDVDTTGAVAGRRAKNEKLTMRDLHVLLDGKTSDRHDGGQGNATASTHTFWDEEVVLNGKPTRREAALQFLERRHALDMRAGHYGQTENNGQEEAPASTEVEAGEEPTTRLFDRNVRLRIANELLALSSASGEEQVTPAGSSNNVHDKLVALYRARVKEELATWVTAVSRRSEL